MSHIPPFISLSFISHLRPYFSPKATYSFLQMWCRCLDLPFTNDDIYFMWASQEFIYLNIIVQYISFTFSWFFLSFDHLSIHVDISWCCPFRLPAVEYFIIFVLWTDRLTPSLSHLFTLSSVLTKTLRYRYCFLHLWDMELRLKKVNNCQEHSNGEAMN